MNYNFEQNYKLHGSTVMSYVFEQNYVGVH
jgi:hypothetical protein